MLRVLTIFLFSTFPALVCAQEEDKKKAEAAKKPARFKVVKLTEPNAFLGKYNGNAEIPKSELLKADSVQVKHCFNLPSEYVVNRFRLSTFFNGQYFSYLVRGCRLTTEIKSLLVKTVGGTKIRIYGIVAAKKTKRDSLRKDFDEINLQVLDDTDTNLITYKLKNKIPEPGLFSIKKQLPNKVTRLDLMFVDQLLVKCDCKIPSLSTRFSVMSFEMKAYHQGNNTIYTTHGADLTEEMRDALVHAKTGTKFKIEKIQVRTADGVVGYLRPRTFKVIP